MTKLVKIEPTENSAELSNWLESLFPKQFYRVK